MTDSTDSDYQETQLRGLGFARADHFMRSQKSEGKAVIVTLTFFNHRQGKIASFVYRKKEVERNFFVVSGDYLFTIDAYDRKWIGLDRYGHMRDALTRNLQFEERGNRMGEAR